MQMIDPEQVGISAERLIFLDKALQRYVDQGKVAGIVAVLSRRGQVFHARGYGAADLSTNQPMQPDTLVRLWSITKVITTVATLICYERGDFVLDQPIADFIPAFGTSLVYAGMERDEPRFVKQERPITIRHLLTHTGGIPSGFGGATEPPEGILRAKIEALQTSPISITKIVESISQVPLVAQPNTLWRYGQSFEILARLVEITSGLPFADFLQTHIFDPLGMTDTGYLIEDDRIGRLSAFYRRAQDGSLSLLEAPRQSIHYTSNGHRLPGQWQHGGAGLVSTAWDIQRLGNMLLNRGALYEAYILAPSTVDLMTSNHLRADLLPYHFPNAQPIYGYGHGLGVHTLMDCGLAGTPCATGEYWKDGGSGTLLWVDPHYELVGTVCYQLDPFWIYPIFATAKALTYQAIRA